MNKFLIIIFMLISSLSAPAQEKQGGTKRILGSKELPLELNLVIQTLQDINPSNEELLRTIMTIDSYARHLSKEDIFLIGKIEIYKSLLKTNGFHSRARIDGDSLTVLKAGLKKARDPFIKWFLQALLHDSESLMSSAIFKDYTFQKNNGRLEKLEYKRIDKKVHLLYRWISKLNPDSTDFENSLKADLSPVLMECLKNVSESFFIMAQNTTNSKMAVISNPSEMKFFQMFQVKPETKPAKKEKSVDEILAPLTGENPVPEATLPEPSKEDWLNDDNAPANLKNLPKPSNDADWLQDI